MTTEYYREFSQCLGMDVEMKVYGDRGVPILYIVTTDENKLVHRELMKLADTHRVQIFEIANPILVYGKIDSNSEASYFIEQFYNHVVHEIVPRVFNINTKSNNGERCSGIYTVGDGRISGAAVNYFLRRPDIFLGTLSLNGIFDLSAVIGDFMDKYVYDNSPLIYLDNMADDHPYIEMYNRFDNIFILNSSEIQTVASAKALQEVFARRNIKANWIFTGTDELEVTEQGVETCLEKLIAQEKCSSAQSS